MDIKHNDDAFAAMLLTLSLTADKEELSKPLSATEYSNLIKRVSESPIRRPGALMGMDVTGIMRALGVDEAEAYRLCMLMSRTMPLSYAMERFYDQCVSILTICDAEYPQSLGMRLGENAPPAVYLCGDTALLKKPMVGLLGISGVKLDADTQTGLRALVRGLINEGFGIVTSSEPGACRIAENEAFEHGGDVICVMAGDMLARSREEKYMDAIAQKRALLMSIVHPESPYTTQHAAARNRCVFALSLAAFIVTSDARRGETEAMRLKYSDWVYAFDIPKPEGNRLLIARGAAPIRDVDKLPISKYAGNWMSARAEQLSLF